MARCVRCGEKKRKGRKEGSKKASKQWREGGVGERLQGRKERKEGMKKTREGGH